MDVIGVVVSAVTRIVSDYSQLAAGDLKGYRLADRDFFLMIDIDNGLVNLFRSFALLDLFEKFTGISEVMVKLLFGC